MLLVTNNRDRQTDRHSDRETDRAVRGADRKREQVCLKPPIPGYNSIFSTTFVVVSVGTDVDTPFDHRCNDKLFI